MSEKPGYWDVHTCAWVGAEPSHVGPPLAGSDPIAALDESVPEQRPAVELPVAADAPD